MLAEDPSLLLISTFFVGEECVRVWSVLLWFEQVVRVCWRWILRRGIIHSALTLRFGLALLRPAKKKQKRRAQAHFQLSTFSAHCGALLSFVFRCMKFGFWFVDTGGPGGDNEC
jgi:hypothetical protein